MIELGFIYGFAVGITCEYDIEFDLRIFCGFFYIKLCI